MISSILSNLTPSQRGQPGSPTNMAGNKAAPQPAIRTPEIKMTINNKADAPKASSSDKAGEKKSAPESKPKSSPLESLLDMFKKGAEFAKVLFEGLGKIGSSIASLASGLAGPLMKLLSMGK
jgi:hypothetical protein